MRKNTKKTKIAVALGIFAGFGVAAIPMASYAENDVAGDVQVQTEVAPSLAMRIKSNADDYTYTEVTPVGTENPSTEGWYVESDGVYSLTDDATVQAGTTYYTRSATDFGFIGYNPATAQGPTDPAAVAGPSQATGLTLSSNQADTTTLYSNIQVRSNTGKFKLEVADTDADTALRNSGGSTTANQYIPAGVTTTTQGGNTVVDPTVAGWALKGGDVSTWTAVPASTGTPLVISALGTNGVAPLAYSSNVTVNYAVASGLTKTDTYGDVVTYTATALDSSYTLPSAGD